MSNIEVLNLDFNRLVQLNEHFGANLKWLKFLYLRENPLHLITGTVLPNNPNLEVVRSDSLMLCCATHYVRDCCPRRQLLTSCHSLLAFFTAKVSVTIQAIIGMLANGTALYVIMISKQRDPDLPLMLSLVLADCMMVIYLLTMAITDFSSSGNFHVHIAQWSETYTCFGAAISNLISIEVSPSVLSVLSVFRAVDIQRNKSPSEKLLVQMVTVGIWTATTCLVSFYLYQYNFGNFSVGNNICVIRAIYNQRKVSDAEQFLHYVLLSLNAFQLFVMSVCTVKIAVRVSKYQKLGKTVNLRAPFPQTSEMKVETKVSLFLLLNLLCGIRILTVAGMSLADGEGHEKIQVWTAIFAIPLSAAANPFLHTVKLRSTATR